MSKYYLDVMDIKEIPYRAGLGVYHSKDEDDTG